MHLVFYTCSLLLPLGDKKGSFERSISAWQRRRRQWILPTCPARHTSCPRLLLSIGLLPRWTCSVVCIEAAIVCFARRTLPAKHHHSLLLYPPRCPLHRRLSTHLWLWLPPAPVRSAAGCYPVICPSQCQEHPSNELYGRLSVQPHDAQLLNNFPGSYVDKLKSPSSGLRASRGHAANLT